LKKYLPGQARTIGECGLSANAPDRTWNQWKHLLTDVDSFGLPIDSAWASSRDRNERLVEIKQIKGQSETHPLLSPNDEFASYELFQDALLGQPATGGRINHIQGGYARMKESNDARHPP
jgi:hypothetical protein